MVILSIPRSSALLLESFCCSLLARGGEDALGAGEGRLGGVAQAEDLLAGVVMICGRLRRGVGLILGAGVGTGELVGWDKAWLVTLCMSRPELSSGVLKLFFLWRLLGGRGGAFGSWRRAR